MKTKADKKGIFSFDFWQKFGKALMVVIAVMPAAGIMISIGKVDIAGATIRTRLDDSSKLFSWINLQSVIIPKANGLYVVIKKKHKGHLRGGEWFTELETIRQGAAV